MSRNRGFDQLMLVAALTGMIRESYGLTHATVPESPLRPCKICGKESPRNKFACSAEHHREWITGSKHKQEQPK
jgi:hypothetical protein